MLRNPKLAESGKLIIEAGLKLGPRMTKLFTEESAKAPFTDRPFPRRNRKPQVSGNSKDFNKSCMNSNASSLQRVCFLFFHFNIVVDPIGHKLVAAIGQILRLLEELVRCHLGCSQPVSAFRGGHKSRLPCARLKGCACHPAATGLGSCFVSKGL